MTNFEVKMTMIVLMRVVLICISCSAGVFCDRLKRCFLRLTTLKRIRIASMSHIQASWSRKTKSEKTILQTAQIATEV